MGLAIGSLCPDLGAQFSRVNNGDLVLWGSRVGSFGFDSLYEIRSFQDLSENDVTSIQPRGLQVLQTRSL